MGVVGGGGFVHHRGVPTGPKKKLSRKVATIFIERVGEAVP